MTLTAARMKVVTQMGNNGHAGDGLRRWKEYIDAGTIGTPKEIHVWIMSLEGADQALAERIGQTVDVR